MAHHNTVFAQLLKFVPRHEFESLANRHHEGQKLRKMSRWSQYVALCLAQVAGRSSPRDIVSNISAQTAKLYHLGSARVTRTSLARVNERQPYILILPTNDGHPAKRVNYATEVNYDKTGRKEQGNTAAAFLSFDKSDTCRENRPFDFSRILASYDSISSPFRAITLILLATSSNLSEIFRVELLGFG